MTVQVDPSATRLGDSNGDGVEDVQLRLDRRALMSGVSGYGELLLTAQGAYRSGVEARGSTPLRLLRAAGNPRGLEPTP